MDSDILGLVVSHWLPNFLAFLIFAGIAALSWTYDTVKKRDFIHSYHNTLTWFFTTFTEVQGEYLPLLLAQRADLLLFQYTTQAEYLTNVQSKCLEISVSTVPAAWW